MIIKGEVERMLRENICVVEFTKTNGDMRSMPCTLRADMLPPTKGLGKPSTANMTVWCVDKGAWRSFKLENVKSVRVLEQRI